MTIQEVKSVAIVLFPSGTLKIMGQREVEPSGGILIHWTDTAEQAKQLVIHTCTRCYDGENYVLDKDMFDPQQTEEKKLTFIPEIKKHFAISHLKIFGEGVKPEVLKRKTKGKL